MRTCYRALILLLVAIPGVVQAATYTVKPLVINETLVPRDIFRTEITVHNTANHIVNVYPSVNEITLDSGGGIAEFVEPSMTDRTTSVTSWIEIKRSGIEVLPNATATIPLKIHVNPFAVEGEYHALLGFGSGQNVTVAHTQVREGKAPSIVLSITIDEEKQTIANLDGFFVERFITKVDNNGVKYTLNNSGDLAIVPVGEVLFYNTSGEEVAAIPVNTEKTPVAPGEQYTFAASVPIDTMLGKYKAFLSLQYGSGQKALVTDTAFFYVLPWQKLAVIFVIILILTIMIALYMHRRVYEDPEAGDDVPLRFRPGVSEAQDHDIDLSTKA